MFFEKRLFCVFDHVVFFVKEVEGVVLEADVDGLRDRLVSEEGLSKSCSVLEFAEIGSRLFHLLVRGFYGGASTHSVGCQVQRVSLLNFGFFHWLKLFYLVIKL